MTSKYCNAILWIMLLACATSSVAAQSPEGSATARCAAFEAAADRFVPRTSHQPLVLRDSTNTPPRQVLEAVIRGIADLDSSGVADFLSVNESRRTPVPCVSLPSGAPLIVLADSARLATPRGAAVFWPAFYAAYPGAKGLTSVSGIGLNAQATQAILVLSNGCGGRCGQQTLVVLKRDSRGAWVVHYSRVLAVS